MWKIEHMGRHDYLMCPECGMGHEIKISKLWKFCPYCGKDNKGRGRKKKDIIYISNGYSDGLPVYDEAECPNCSKHFEEYGEAWKCNFCPDCGQALNWDCEEKEDENTDHI